MMTVVGLLYLAEVSLPSPWRWFAIAIGGILAMRLRSQNASALRRFRPTAALAALAIGTAAAYSQSPVLGVCAILLLSPRLEHRRTAAMTLVAIGVHLTWWRYLATFPLRGVPAPVAALASWLLSPIVYVTPTAFVVQGHTISWSSLPLVTAFAPVIAAVLMASPDQLVLKRMAASAAATVAALLAVIVTLTLWGHTHFSETPWWPILVVAISVMAAAWIRPSAGISEPRWGLWLLSASLVCVAWNAGIGPNRVALRVAFDEGHGQWETVRAVFRREAYGRDTTYNYGLLFQWLGSKHHVSVIDADWSNIAADVLVVKMPTKFFAEAEKQAIGRFVRAGGLLIVIGDHTNLYGTAFVINDLVGPYGLEIEADATVPLDGEHYDLRPAWWQRTRYLRGIEEIQFQTAATILAHSPFVLPVLVGDRVVGEDADYSNDRFFGDLHPGLEDRQSPLVVAAERRVGAGRVLLFGDSTIFSSFSVMTPGNADVFQNFIEQGTVQRSVWRVIITVGLIALALIAARDSRLVFGLSAVVLVVAVGGFAGRASASLDTYSAARLDVDGAHSRLELRADTRNAHGPAFDDYSTFFAWIGRTGAFPHVSRNAYDDPQTATLILNPLQVFTLNELDRIERYVKRGGRLLVMDDGRFASRTTAGPLLARFGIDLRPTIGAGRLFDAGPPALSPNLLGVPFDLLGFGPRQLGNERASGTQVKVVPVGATPLLVDADGGVVAAEKAVGRGAVVVFLDSSVFSDFVMGDVWGGDDPSPEQQRLYQLEFDLIDRVTRRSHK